MSYLPFNVYLINPSLQLAFWYTNGATPWAFPSLPQEATSVRLLSPGGDEVIMPIPW